MVGISLGDVELAVGIVEGTLKIRDRRSVTDEITSMSGHRFVSYFVRHIPHPAHVRIVGFSDKWLFVVN
jgi:hypothetical protein